MASKPKSAEMVPGPGFRVRMNFERPPKELIDHYRQFETPDISDMPGLTRMCDPCLAGIRATLTLDCTRGHQLNFITSYSH